MNALKRKDILNNLETKKKKKKKMKKMRKKEKKVKKGKSKEEKGYPDSPQLLLPDLGCRQQLHTRLSSSPSLDNLVILERDLRLSSSLKKNLC